MKYITYHLKTKNAHDFDQIWGSSRKLWIWTTNLLSSPFLFPPKKKRKEEKEIEYQKS